MITFPGVLLLVGALCLALAGWALIQGELWNASLGIGLAVLLLLYRRWSRGRSD